MSNEIAKKPTFTMTINSEGYKKLINKTLGDGAKAQRFIASITSAVVTNPALSECDAKSIISAGFLGESLNLSPSPQLGQYYLVPFKIKAKYDKGGNLIQPETYNAQFIPGYKGYIQLAIRSGQYKKINVIEIKQGELVRFDILNEELECHLIEDEQLREGTPTIGYYAMFEYLNGFRKALYWSKEKMLSHADEYSAAFSREAYEKIQRGEIADKDMWKYSSFWYKNFDDMAKKTMLRQLISKWGIMSIEMETAYANDGVIVNSDGSCEYVDMPETIEAQSEPIPATETSEEVDINAI